MTLLVLLVFTKQIATSLITNKQSTSLKYSTGKCMIVQHFIFILHMFHIPKY